MPLEFKEPLIYPVTPAQAHEGSPLRRQGSILLIRIDYELLLQFALRAIGCRAADVPASAVLPAQE